MDDLSISVVGERIVLEFNHKVQWIALDQSQAIEMARNLGAALRELELRTRSKGCAVRVAGEGEDEVIVVGNPYFEDDSEMEN